MRVPLLYKPGISRDGTNFQDEYCTDGNWIRFVSGKIRKMKGQAEVISQNVLPDGITSMDIYSTTAGARLFCTTDNEIWMYPFDTATNTLGAAVNATPVGIAPNVNRTWQSIKFTRQGQPCIAYLATYNKTNIDSNTAGQLYWKSLNDNNRFVLSNITGPNANNVTGGIMYSAPFIFLYGSNGALLRSRTADPLNFDGGDSGYDSLCENKLLFGANIRGGSNAPSLLFWTANSVIYLTNVADPNNANLPVNFQKEVVTENSSVLSPRGIVQYDSMFFWLGTDRIFNYNSIVDTVPNTINAQWFFDNIDINKRQKVFGYKITRYGEIRWAFPEIVNNGNAAIGNTRELVYNVRENSWYDTVISRTCYATYVNTGVTYSFGDSVTGVNYRRIWKHEEGYVENRVGAANTLIRSFFTTPWYGFVTFNPAKSGVGLDKYIVLDQIEPDFPSENRINGDNLNFIFSTKKYASSFVVNSDAFNYDLGNGNPGKIDFRIQGRFIQITTVCDYDYIVGTVLINFKEGDAQ